MSFQRTSLRKKAQKRRLKKGMKRMGIMGKATIGLGIGALVLVPKLLWNAVLHKREEQRQKRFVLFGIIFVLFSLLFAFFWTETGRQTAKTVVKTAVFSLGAELPKDENELTNVLILGRGGGDKHEGKGHNLTDSMIIASIDAEGRSVALLSIPRDFFVETDRVSTRVNSVIRDESSIILRELRQIPENAKQIRSLTGKERKEFDWKLDAIAHEKSKKILKKTLEDIFQIQIHRIAEIDFSGFQELVNAVGGIDVVVEKSINDQTYPDFEWGYDPFIIEAGAHHMDGETALKYARSRHGSSDFDRAARQQKVLTALKEKLSSLGILTSPAKLKDIYGVMQQNFRTDLSWEEMITLAKIAESLPRENISQSVLHDDPGKKGGFLVTPDRELYGGAFVLVPFLNLEADKYAQIRAFSHILFLNRYLKEMNISILNASDTSGIAGKLAQHFDRYGIEIDEIDNAEENQKKSVIRFTDIPQYRAAAELFQTFLPIELEPQERQTIQVQEGEKTVEKETSLSFEIILGEDRVKPYRIPKS